MKYYKIIPALCTLVCAVACSSTKPKAIPNPTPALSAITTAKAKHKTRLAIKIMTLNGGKKLGNQVISQLSGRLPDAQRSILLKAVNSGDLLQVAAIVYTKRFSANELQDIIDYFESPTGVMFIKRAPAAGALTEKFMDSYGQKMKAGEPVTLPIPGEDKDDPLRNAIALMDISGEKALGEYLLETMLRIIKRTNPEKAQELAKVFDIEVLTLLAAKAYTEIYSVKELQSMIQFFETPTGIKYGKNRAIMAWEAGKAAENYFKDNFQQ
jgi:hypothetical protein